MALEVIVVQHREKERLPGDPGPTSRGHEEAAATAGLLASNGGAVALYSSPLRRATKTAEFLAASWVGTSPGPDEQSVGQVPRR